MGWGIYFNTQVYLSRMSFSDIDDVNRKIEENNRSIKDLSCQIKMMGSANPKDIIPDEWKEEPIRWISNEIDSLLELIGDFERENARLYLYVDYLESDNKDDIVINWKELKQFYLDVTKSENLFDPSSKEQMTEVIEHYKNKK
jgi:hypothetical protein